MHSSTKNNIGSPSARQSTIVYTAPNFAQQDYPEKRRFLVKYQGSLGFNLCYHWVWTLILENIGEKKKVVVGGKSPFHFNK